VTAAALPRAGSIENGVHRFPIRVYYEDTDAAGIVYYANYLKFVERARTEMMRLFGVEHEAERQTSGLAFIVRRAEMEFEAPARLDDELVVETAVKEVGGASILLSQNVLRDARVLVRATILVATIGASGRPVRLPATLRATLSSHPASHRMVSAHAR
jgi:acyl-CoA thioester hydrolase